MEDKSFMVREGPEDHSEGANIIVHGLDDDGDPLCGLNPDATYGGWSPRRIGVPTMVTCPNCMDELLA